MMCPSSISDSAFIFRIIRERCAVERAETRCPARLSPVFAIVYRHGLQWDGARGQRRLELSLVSGFSEKRAQPRDFGTPDPLGIGVLGGTASGITRFEGDNAHLE